MADETIRSEQVELFEHLAVLDENPKAEVHETIRQLHSELTTLASQLSNSPPHDSCMEEPACQQALVRIKALIHNTVMSTASLAASEDGSEEDEADQIPESLEHFRILKLLGKGGMGAVYLAEDTRLGRQVAIKTLRRGLAKKKAARERFLREARLAATIEHDHVVPIYYVGEADGIPFLAMPYLKGKSLEELLRNHQKLPLRHVLHLGLQIASGLAIAHEKGLIHRDIKPSNLWVEPIGGGRIKILDFGLARSNEDDMTLTQSGVILGTPAFMAPEQAKGEKVDARADLYSLGVVLYRMATGQLPISGTDTYSMLVALATEQPRPVMELAPELPPNLADLIMRLLAKDRNLRPASARDVARELRNILETWKTAGHSPSPSTAMPGRQVALPLAQPVSSPVRESEVENNPWISLASSEDTPSPETPLRTQRQPRRSRPYLPLLVAFGIAGLAILILLGAITIIIRDKSGKEIARLEIDEGSIVEVKEGGRIVKVWPQTDTKARSSPSGASKQPGSTGNLEKDPDRRAALWVLSVGGSIRIRPLGQNDQIIPVTNLPAEPFELHEVSLNYNPHVTDSELAYLTELKGLAVLHLRGTKVTDAGLFHLRNVKSLKDLDLVDCKHITDGGLGHLRELTNLDRLWVYATPISNDGLTHIKDLKNLTSLNVGYTKVTEAGLDQILELKNLTFLHIGGSKITDAGVARLKELKSLKYLDINGNPITDAGLAHLKELPDLTWLNLSATEITDVGLIHLKEMKKLTRLEFRKNKGLTDAGLIHLGEMSQLTGLFLEELSITDAGLIPLKGLKNLTLLSLAGTPITDAGLSHLNSTRSLDDLNLSNTRVSDRSLAWIGLQAGKKRISLVNTRISREGYESLKRTHPQSGIRLEWSERNHGLAQVVLRLGGQVWIASREEAEAKPVKNADELIRGYFQVRRVTLAGVREPLGNLPAMLAQLSDPVWDRLEVLELTGQPVPDLVFLQGIKTLTELRLIEAQLNDQTLSRLPPLPKLKKLVLDGNEIGAVGAGHLAATFPQLEELSLARTRCDTPAILQLTALKELRVLNLANTAIQDNALKEIAKLLKLESLDLRGTKVSANGVAELQKALPKCRVIWDETR
jgi:serine/threonine protein kinase/Leucine-rich repeat (LRR) protein